jgi:hypothetical protein
MTLIGLISDTHGLVRPEVAAALAGVCRIVHAGDIGKPEVLGALSAIAPVTAVRGNVDHGPWTAALPADAAVSVNGHGIYVLHNLNDLEIASKAAGITAVIYGHTHEPLIEDRGGVLYINPGSAGPRRFSLPISIGFLRLAENAAPVAWLQTIEA